MAPVEIPRLHARRSAPLPLPTAQHPRGLSSGSRTAARTGLQLRTTCARSACLRHLREIAIRLPFAPIQVRSPSAVAGHAARGPASRFPRSISPSSIPRAACRSSPPRRPSHVRQSRPPRPDNSEQLAPASCEAHARLIAEAFALAPRAPAIAIGVLQVCSGLVRAARPHAASRPSRAARASRSSISMVLRAGLGVTQAPLMPSNRSQKLTRAEKPNVRGWLVR
jgi:hypothetical protein